LIRGQELMAIDTPVSDLETSSAALSDSSGDRRSAKDSDEISLLDLLIVLAERKGIIIWTTLFFAIVALVVTLLLPKKYTATVTLLPPQQNSSLSSQLASQFGSIAGMMALTGGGGGLLKNPTDMYVAMFKSRTVEDAMIDRFGLMQEYHKRYRSDARKKLEHYSTVDGSGKDGLIHVSVEDHDPKRAAELANGYVDAFRDLSKGLAFTEAQQRVSFFNKQLEDAKGKLADAEEALKETEQTTGVIQLDAQARALVESAAALRAQIAAKEVEIQGMQTYATGQNAQLVEAQQELSSLRTQLAKLGGSSDSSDAIIVPKGQMTEAGLQYVRKLRDVKYYETIFDILARQFELAKLDEAKEGAIIQVVDSAVPPDKKSFPHLGIILPIATFAGLVIGVFIALIQGAWASLRQDEKALAKINDLKQALLRNSVN
jgi:tyrosine-protein kinase Etk/Wzc